MFTLFQSKFINYKIFVNNEQNGSVKLQKNLSNSQIELEAIEALNFLKNEDNTHIIKTIINKKDRSISFIVESNRLEWTITRDNKNIVFEFFPNGLFNDSREYKLSFKDAIRFKNNLNSCLDELLRN